MTPFEPGARAVARCDLLGHRPYSERDDQLTRRYLTPAHAAALKTVRAWMVEAGMTVRLDGAANLIGRYEGATPGAPALMIGSHIDSVSDAGRYDGPLGVLLAIDCVEAVARSGRPPPFALEVIAFGDEEGSRFPAAMTCSRAVAGTLDADVLGMRDADGVSVADARLAFDASLPPLASAARAPGEILGYLEPHIEQGPVLEAEDLAIGVVTAIAAQKRLMIRIDGVAGHAGTTPMHLRRDPCAAAAEAMLAIERLCISEPGLVGTVGRIAVLPGAFNVIPRTAEFSLDLRAPTARRRDDALARICREIEGLTARRRVTVRIDLLQTLPECPCDEGATPRRLASGAAHDAMALADLCPTAMLFIRCKGGVSHNPAESVEPADAAIAARAMLAFIDRLAGGHAPEREGRARAVA